VTDSLNHFLEPTFADSRYIHVEPSTGAEISDLVVGGFIALAGIAAAFFVFIKNPSMRARLQERYSGVHRFLLNKWYFDEVFDALFVRPGATLGRFGRTVVESSFVQGFLVGGTVGLVRAGTSFARSIQTGELRSYALLLVVGLGGLVLYFLIVSS
jgi:NADH-quinone oxidoreductase subunit L